MVNTRKSARDKGAKMTREERIAAKRATLRANRQQRSDYDSPWGRQFKSFKPNDGRNRIRVLPFPDHDHYALPVQVHYGVGPDNGSYLCLKHNSEEVLGQPRSRCPICDYADQLRREAEDIRDEDKREAAKREANRMRAKERRLMLLIDREHESEGIQFWAAPFSIDEALIDLADDPDTGEVLFIEDVDEGHDVIFRREGTGIATKYSSYQIKPSPSPVSESATRQEEWVGALDSISVSDLVQIYPASRLEEVLFGAPVSPEAEAADDPDPVTPSRAKADVPDDDEEDDVVAETTGTDDSDDDLWD